VPFARDDRGWKCPGVALYLWAFGSQFGFQRSGGNTNVRTGKDPMIAANPDPCDIFNP
jgi:hypothetical protein